MNAIRALQSLGQGIWLECRVRELLESGKLEPYVERYAVTGLTSSAAFFSQAISSSTAYDHDIRMYREYGLSSEQVFYELAVEDLARAAKALAHVYNRAAGHDGFVSLDVSPFLAHSTEDLVLQATEFHRKL
ncbi:MAG TPA: transaldolase family protein, partial [Rectinemataceae bacterium]|nr:transaldolase family protein [Rectinemataceae bacterium]